MTQPSGKVNHFFRFRQLEFLDSERRVMRLQNTGIVCSAEPVYRRPYANGGASLEGSLANLR